MNKIFLTGSNGFVGKHLLRRLIEMGYHVETDMRYLHTRKYDCVIHLAAKTDISCEFNSDLIESNIILTREIFKVNSRIIFGSSCSSEFLTNPYSYTKRYGEHLCQLHGNAVALRFFNIYGYGAGRGIVKFLMDQPNNAKITLRGIDQIRDYVHCDDVVDSIISSINPHPILIDMKELRVASDKAALITEKLLDYAMEKNISFVDVNPPMELISRSKIIEVGSGVGTSTMDLCNLYMKLSGKTFDISVIDPHPSEPPEMVAKYPTLCISLEEGLRKTINI